MGEKINDFNNDNDFAGSDPVNEMFEKAYKMLLGERIKSIELAEQGACESQFAGIDRILHLHDITFDEKVRRGVWSDILLEYISNDTTMTPGWIEKDLKCNSIAYGFLQTGTVYILKFEKLKSIWNDNKEQWKKEFREIKAKNNDYYTISCAVPIEILLKKMGSSAIKLNTKNG